MLASELVVMAQHRLDEAIEVDFAGRRYRAQQHAARLAVRMLRWRLLGERHHRRVGLAGRVEHDFVAAAAVRRLVDGIDGVDVVVVLVLMVHEAADGRNVFGEAADKVAGRIVVGDNEHLAGAEWRFRCKVVGRKS